MKDSTRDLLQKIFNIFVKEGLQLQTHFGFVITDLELVENRTLNVKKPSDSQNT